MIKCNEPVHTNLFWNKCSFLRFFVGWIIINFQYSIFSCPSIGFNSITQFFFIAFLLLIL